MTNASKKVGGGNGMNKALTGAMFMMVAVAGGILLAGVVKKKFLTNTASTAEEVQFDCKYYG